MNSVKPNAGASAYLGVPNVIEFARQFTENNPGWWTPRKSKPVDSHSGVLVEYKSRQQKYKKIKVGEKGFAFVDGEIIEVYVAERHRYLDDFTLVVMPTLKADERYDVDIDYYSRARGRLMKKMEVKV